MIYLIIPIDLYLPLPLWKNFGILTRLVGFENYYKKSYLSMCVGIYTLSVVSHFRGELMANIAGENNAEVGSCMQPC